MLYPFSDLLSLSNYSFRRPFYERDGYTVKETENGLLILFNALGVKKEDIKLEVKSSSNNKQIVAITGKTHDEDLDYDFEVKTNFYIGRRMEKVVWDVLDGFMKIWVIFEEPVKPSVAIVRK